MRWEKGLIGGEGVIPITQRESLHFLKGGNFEKKLPLQNVTFCILGGMGGRGEGEEKEKRVDSVKRLSLREINTMGDKVRKYEERNLCQWKIIVRGSGRGQGGKKKKSCLFCPSIEAVRSADQVLKN